MPLVAYKIWAILYLFLNHASETVSSLSSLGSSCVRHILETMAKNRLKNKPKRRLRILGLRPGVYMLICLSMYLFQAVISQTKASRLQYDLFREVHIYHELERDNQNLRVTAAQLQAIDSIAVIAKNEGFVPANYSYYVPSVLHQP
jgi:hypothetical protein